MSHTPGDWYVGTRSAFTQEIEILAGPLRPVGSAYTEDDARVMAAGPKLLEALKMHAERFEKSDEDTELHWRTMEAIKEATGGTV